MYFYPFGPFEITRNGTCISEHKDDKQQFWHNVEEQEKSLPDACGCYIFIINNKVWYVGRTKKQGFRGECFADHKIKIFDKALIEHKGIPKLILIARYTNSDRLSQPSNGHNDIVFLEKILIGYGVKCNPDLLNVKDTKYLRELTVPGVINTGRGEANAKSVQSLKQVLGIG